MYKIKPPYSINIQAEVAAIAALKDKNFIKKSVTQFVWAKVKKNIWNLFNKNKWCQLILLLNFCNCKFSTYTLKRS